MRAEREENRDKAKLWRAETWEPKRLALTAVRLGPDRSRASASLSLR